MQLDRILQSQGFGSRKECRGLVRHGFVVIGGEVQEDPFADLDPTGLEIEVDGETWAYHEVAYVMLHKPTGYEVSHKPIHHPSVFSLLPSPLRARGVQAVGRLDEDTTGMLILTEDGQLIHQLSSPKRAIPKIYQVTLKHPANDELVAALLAGVQLHDEPEPVVAAGCEIVGECALRLTITGGKYHQVKRMIAAAGNRVEALHRNAIGRLELPADLAPGEWRWLTPADLAALRCEAD
ncbi:16S rRNA pseudouridine(516) synthase [Niveibacterium umoris]|uniref:Ribosomal small subunit pseudouridine synthase A n=1 Tax=Niveibacterium umoris TaxID=1193620 RepID=A0A840BN04_9RHOO|nr:16S rRNA pseudouridine(516) synthase [Niveibacterium umoris]MBB4013934.1 16S rRNA pseudouridine516 synthase [Niveibacterium umoris]